MWIKINLRNENSALVKQKTFFINCLDIDSQIANMHWISYFAGSNSRCSQPQRLGNKEYNIQRLLLAKHTAFWCYQLFFQVYLKAHLNLVYPNNSASFSFNSVSQNYFSLSYNQPYEADRIGEKSISQDQRCVKQPLLLLAKLLYDLFNNSLFLFSSTIYQSYNVLLLTYKSCKFLPCFYLLRCP